MTAQTLRNLIYYPNGPSGIEEDMATIAADPYFTNVVLGQFHFNETTGELSWNQTPISSVTPEEWEAVQGLSQGEYPKIVSMQIGSAGNGTWKYIASQMSAAATTLVNAVTGEYPIAGIDLDPEETGGEVSAQTLYDFTLLLGSSKQDTPFYLSHVPVPGAGYFSVYGPDYWPQLAPYIDWITPQWYYATGSQLVSDYERFASEHIVPTPYPAPQPFPPLLVAGQESSVTTLDELTSAIQDLVANYGSNWGGVGVWSYPLPSFDWGEAIYNAMHGLGK